ncbi:hypothetical protein JL720_2787 [Aureococcus anophagefferens]|uniref:Multifunctional methyltransferase subunit TRM112-like protein n=1 Tax=Aureococcus anophagefferens TaxID=44056 RepID=F0YF57_AURAN|nr:hypothetical protein AURANDRAFT_29541 [Aureococcus anophagefferens]EGB06226.1 hypothetical protein AURANDRAFT_29541 [Aureococcus anophagefferens]KAH8095485.1 hypothetical protein JL720_2787 [Aureococcus anophagefferens]|eukprot:XP_009039174.1 hypothetical protein AURANDRAFT_29541 [Aureococcus anophagefferens]
MRLLTLNTLKCTRKDVTDGRLRLVATKVEVRQNSEFDAEFLEHVLPTLEWPSLVASASTVGVTLPPALDDALRGDEAFLRALQHVLFDVHVIEGQLVCEESGQTFPIEEGRPNMMLDEGLL